MRVGPATGQLETWQHRAYAGTAQDAHRNAVDSWGEPVDVLGCQFDPGGSAEPGNDNRVVTSPTLYAPVRDVDARDLFLGRGHTWQVDGDPADWGQDLPLVISLRKVDR